MGGRVSPSEPRDPLAWMGTTAPLGTARFLWGLRRGRPRGCGHLPSGFQSFLAAAGGPGWPTAPPQSWVCCSPALIWDGQCSRLAELELALNSLTSGSVRVCGVWPRRRRALDLGPHIIACVGSVGASSSWGGPCRAVLGAGVTTGMWVGRLQRVGWAEGVPEGLRRAGLLRRLLAASEHGPAIPVPAWAEVGKAGGFPAGIGVCRVGGMFSY